MNESAIASILKYINKYLFEPRANWPKYYFDQRSYSRWAAYEILESIMKHSSISPTTIIAEFIVKMGYFSHMSEDTNKTLVFSIAKDTAEDILLYLYD